LANSDQNNHDKFSNSEIFDRVFVTDNDFGVDDLPLFFELFIFSNFLKVFTNFNQLGMKFVDLRFLSQLHEMSLIMSVKIKRNRFVLTIS
jgi:hypothetical protein